MTGDDISEPKKAPSGAAKWLIGCSVAVVVVGLSCAGLAWWGVRALETAAGEWAHEALTAMIEKSHLPPEQADSMYADLERARLAVEEGRLGWRDLERLEDLEGEIERLASLGVIQWFASSVVPEVELPPEEEDEAVRTLQRLGRGVQEDLINRHEASSSISVQVEVRGEDEWDQEDVRIVVAKARRLVEEFEIPDEPYVIDVAKEFKELIDGLLE